MVKRLCLTMLVATAVLVGCDEPSGDYVAASSISSNGFARHGKEMRKAIGQEMKIWGFVDHSNIYGNEDVKKILGDWWSGEGPSADTWRFGLKAGANDASGHSFAIHIPNDHPRDGLLDVFLADARARRPTKVFVRGKMFTFDAPANLGSYSGLYMVLESSRNIAVEPAGEN